MRKNRNLYKNRLGIPWLSFAVASGLVVLLFGCAYVYLKNQHVLREADKLALSNEIQELEGETEALENQILLAVTPAALERQLQRTGSDLVPIPNGVKITIDGRETVGAMASTGR